MEINSKTLGSLLVGFSIILLFILTFVKIDVDKQSTILCEKFQEDNIDMSECPVHKSNFSWMIILAYGVGFVILVSGVYLVFIHKTTKSEIKKDFKNIDLSKLSDEEKRFYDIIKNNGGSAYQLD